MKQKLTQTTSIRQEIRLTPQMQQFLKVIQMPALELYQFIQTELENNPLLEAEIDYEVAQDSPTPPEDITDALPDPDILFAQDLYNPINEQYDYGESDRLRPEPVSREDWRSEAVKTLKLVLNEPEADIGEYIIFNLDEDGFLRLTDEEIAQALGVEEETVKRTLARLRQILPPGLTARTIKECLLLQIERDEGKESITYRIVNKAFSDLIRRRYRKIARELKVPLKQVNLVAQTLSQYRTRPLVSKDIPACAYPEYEIKIVDGQIVIEKISNMPAPRLRLNQRYIETLRKSKDRSARRFLSHYLQRAKAVIQATQEREEKLLSLLQFLAQRQREFVESGPAYLKPLTMKQASRTTGLSESTISRLANNKYVQVPWGCIRIKDFFLNPLSYTNDTPRDMILGIIREIIESSNQRLSDEKIRELLKERGIQLSRRTVNKYRHMLG